MMTSNARMRALSLYKQLLREAKKFPSYNYRHYFVRRTQDAFREHKDLRDKEEITRLLAQAEQNLTVLRRQVLVNQLYGEGRLIIETETQFKS